jgi:hypothetical protein
MFKVLRGCEYSRQKAQLVLSSGLSLRSARDFDTGYCVAVSLVEHPPVVPSLGYRFDFKDCLIAFSGDTSPLEAVAKMAKGAGVLVHETMYVPAVEGAVEDEIDRRWDEDAERTAGCQRAEEQVLVIVADLDLRQRHHAHGGGGRHARDPRSPRR